MKKDWLRFCLNMMATPADEISGARKIIHNVVASFDEIRPDLQLEELGYTKSKLTMLTRHYLVTESRDAVVPLWDKRVKQRKYGSVSFTTHGHTTKSDPNKGSKRASVLTPCIQSMSLTYHGNTHTAEVHGFYRTTEVFKKFPADLVFIRDVLLPPFDFSQAPLSKMTFFFANVTVHPMYFATMAPFLADPIECLEWVKRYDEYFWMWCVKWTARYTIPEYHRGIQKYAQGMRVHTMFHQLMDPEILEELTEYVAENHPGMSSDYVDPDEEGED